MQKKTGAVNYPPHLTPSEFEVGACKSPVDQRAWR